MHANKDTRLVNWGYNTSGTGPRKNDAGCNFDFVPADPSSVMVDGIAPETLAAVYDLMGRRVASPVKGVYIVDGHKVVIK